jgi:hypothetical protein
MLYEKSRSRNDSILTMESLHLIRVIIGDFIRFKDKDGCGGVAVVHFSMDFGRTNIEESNP